VTASSTTPRTCLCTWNISRLSSS